MMNSSLIRPVDSGNSFQVRLLSGNGFWEMMTKVPDRLSATRK